MKRIHVVKRPRRKWINATHDEQLRHYVLVDKLCNSELAQVMKFNTGTIANHMVRLGLKANRKSNKGSKRGSVPSKPVPLPKDKPNLLELAERKIAGFRRDTFCIHYSGNRVEKLTIDEIIRRVGL